jgi:phosphoglycerol transferase MdoB-like AlkP superfamily enzyme
MKVVVFGLLKRLTFWLVFFALLRMVFLAYYRETILLDEISFTEVLSTFWNALALDLSTACYLLIISYFFLMIYQFTHLKIIIKADRIFALFIMLIYALISTAELGLYAEWKTKLSYKALSYLNNPSEVFNSISTMLFFALIVFWLIQALLPNIFYRRFVANEITLKPTSSGSAWWTLLFVPGFLFVGLRGGLSEIPITTSTSYFSKHQILNLAAVNSGNNMMASILNSYYIEKNNPFITLPDQEARDIVAELHRVEGDSTVKLIDPDRPNIVILLLESWSADLVESLGGEPGITPNFRELEKEGLLFTRFYASGNRSQQAMGSLFSGLPGLPITTITDHPEKYPALPSFIKDIKKEGYYTSFYFGGQLNYGNIRSYLMSTGFDEITEGKDLPSEFDRGKLGVHDEYLFRYMATKLNDQPQPFFTTIFTLSSHSPYDMPMEEVIHWPKAEKAFVNSAHYTDKALGEFFNLAKQQPWYNNTLFLVMADHSHRTYRNHPLGSFEHHKIPLLILGGVLKPEFKNQVYSQVSGNTDITATLLSQLNMDHSAYIWSKDLLNVYYKPFAFFELNEEGFGFQRSDGYVVWDQKAHQFLQKDIPPDQEKQIVKEGDAYLQVLFEDFLAY